jgi:hypothetical protein
MPASTTHWSACWASPSPTARPCASRRRCTGIRRAVLPVLGASSRPVGLPMCELGWQSVGVLELTALPSVGEARWVPWVRDADVLLVEGGDALFLCHWMRQSGLASLLPSLERTVWVGLSAGSMVMTPRVGDAFVATKPPITGDDLTLGVVDFSIFPHLDHPGFTENTMACAEAWAAASAVRPTPSTTRRPCRWSMARSRWSPRGSGGISAPDPRGRGVDASPQSATRRTSLPSTWLDTSARMPSAACSSGKRAVDRGGHARLLRGCRQAPAAARASRSPPASPAAASGTSTTARRAACAPCRRRSGHPLRRRRAPASPRRQRLAQDAQGPVAREVEDHIEAAIGGQGQPSCSR